MTGTGSFPVPFAKFTERTGSASADVHRLTLVVGSPEVLTRADTFYFSVATYHRTLQLAAIRLTDQAGVCVFESVPGSLADNQLIELRRQQCDGVSAGTVLQLEIRTSEPADLALWAGRLFQKNYRQAELLLRHGGQRYTPRAEFVINPPAGIPAVSQLYLLSRIWGGGDMTPALILTTAIFALLLLLGGGALVIYHQCMPFRMAPAGCFLMSLGLGVVYAVSVPPFQAPDEADHFLAFATVSGREDLKAPALDLANAGHYDRILCRVGEKYSRADALQPLVSKWPRHVEKVPVDRRSALGGLYWQLLGRVLPFAAPNTMLLAVRLCNALLFSLAVLLAAYVFTGATRSAVTVVASVLPLFMVPTLWFFSGHVSNHVLLISAYAVSAVFLLRYAGNLATLRDIAMMGAVLGLALASGRAAAILAFFWLGVTVLEAFFRALVTEESPRGFLLHQAAKVSALLVPAAVISLLFATDRYGLVHEVLGIMRSHWQVLAGGLILAGLTGVGAGLAVVYRVRIRSLLERCGRPVALGLLGLTAGILVLPVFHQIPALASIERVVPRIGSLQYAKNVLVAFLGNSGFGGQDFFLIWSFWGGFGCPEPVVGLWMVQLLHALVFIAAGIVLWASVRNKQPGMVFRHVLMLLLCLLYLALLAFATASLQAPFNLHGRYMIGFYLMLAGYFVPAALQDLAGRISSDDTRETILPGACVLVILTIHALSLNYLLDRYFS